MHHSTFSHAPLNGSHTLPTFCPNKECFYHYPQNLPHGKLWYKHHGWFTSQAHGKTQRFYCTKCGKTFSTQTFSVHYWTHQIIDLKDLEYRYVSGSGLAQIGNAIHASYRVIQNRLLRLTRNFLSLFDASHAFNPLDENISFDGFESFAHSQYFPNNYNILVGCDSRMPYGLNVTVMRRKGRMTDRQKKIRDIIDACWRPEKGALTTDVQEILRSMFSLQLDNPSYLAHPHSKMLHLFTDEKKEYARVIAQLPEAQLLDVLNLFSHSTISSKCPRTKHNPLFPSNYLEREIRKNCASHVRETTRWDKEINMGINRLVIMLGHHTYQKPFVVKGGKDIPKETHAEHAGYMKTQEEQILLSELYTHRHLWSHQYVQRSWCEKIWQLRYTNPPIIDIKRKTVKAKGQYGRFYRAAHLSA